MKIADLEDHEKLLSKDYLDAKLAELRAEMSRLHADTLKWMFGMFAGLYAGIILSFFIK